MTKPPAGAGLSKVTIKLPAAPSTGVMPAVMVTTGVKVGGVFKGLMIKDEFE